MSSSKFPGGRGAWLFVVPLFVMVTAGVFYFAYQYRAVDQQRLELMHQEQLHSQEIQSLRAQVDKLQSELAEVGSLAQQKEAQLRQKEAAMQSAQTATDQKETQDKILAQKKELICLECQKKLAQKLRTQVEAKQVSIKRDHAKIILTIPNTGLFDAGTDAVKTEAAPMLTIVGNFIQELPAEVETRVSAYHDNTPLQGTLAQKYPSIQELTAIRANAVSKELLKISNLPPKRVLSVGMGDTQPVVSNQDAEKKAQNRRVEITIDLTPSFQENPLKPSEKK